MDSPPNSQRLPESFVSTGSCPSDGKACVQTTATFIECSDFGRQRLLLRGHVMASLRSADGAGQ